MSTIAESKTVTEAYLRRVKANPDKVGFRHKENGTWKDVTFGQYHQTVRRLACGLVHLGIKPGERVNVLAQTSLAWSQFDLATLSAGAITVPVYPTNTAEDTTYIINHSGAVALFVDDFKNLQKIAAIAKDCPSLKRVVVNFEVRAGDVKAPFEIVHWNTIYDFGLNHEKAIGAQIDQALAAVKPTDTLTITYTSGTTGTPKGVVLTHEAMSSVMLDVAKVILGIVTENEDMLTWLPMSHIFGKFESLTPFYLGWTANFAESVEALVGNLGEVRPTIWFAVPRLFEKVYAKIINQVEASPAARRQIFNWAIGVGKQAVELEARGQRVGLGLAAQRALAGKLVFSKVSSRFGGRLKFCISGSAPLAPSIQMFMHAVGVPVYEGYGLTETCAPICVNLPGLNKFGTVGQIFPEVLVRIADDGEILIKSAKNFKEYYKNPEATAEAIKDGWFYTGDIGQLDADGYLKITDRKKDLIKTAGGKYVAPQKIENLAKAQKVLSQVVLFGDQRPFVVALLTLNQEYVIQYAQGNKILFSDYDELVKNSKIQALVKEAMEAINGQLARYESIKRYIVLPREFTVEDGDLTPSMKIKRKQICTKYKDELEGLYVGAKSGD